MNGTSNSTCIVDLTWRKTHLGITSAKWVFSFRLLHDSVACSYCAGCVCSGSAIGQFRSMVPDGDAVLESSMLVRHLRWPMWGDKGKGKFTLQTLQLVSVTKFGNVWNRWPSFENLVSIVIFANRVQSRTKALPSAKPHNYLFCNQEIWISSPYWNGTLFL